MSTDPAEVASQWDWPAHATLEPVSDGLINDTFRVSLQGADLAILQRLNTRIFGASVHTDIEAITAHLQAAGMATPRLLRTRSGALWLEADGEVWRAMTVVGTTTHHRLTSLNQARSAGALVARFHAHTHTLDHTFAFKRPSPHDTDAHLATLRTALAAHPDHPLHAEVGVLEQRLAQRWHQLRTTAPQGLPTRIIHGDLKVSNLRFDGDEAVALIDLDTMAHSTLDIELGDALRSWCGTAGEDAAEAVFDLDIFEAAMAGYASEAGAWGPTEAEWDAIVWGVARISTELSMRFAADALNERYFGWDADRFATAGAHNLLRAAGQASLSDAVVSAMPEASRRLTEARP